MPLTPEQEKEIAQWCEKNPHTYYADRGDECPDKIANALVEGDLQAAEELMWDAEINMQDGNYESEDYHFQEMLKELGLKEVLEEIDSRTEYSEFEDALRECFRENLQTDFSDLWRGSMRNSGGVNVTCRLYHNGEAIYPPFAYGSDDAENADRCQILNELFGMTQEDCEAIEPTYDYQELKLCGRIDLYDRYQELLALAREGKEFDSKALKVKIGPNDSDNLLFHDSMNGSGSLGTLKVRKEVILDCDCKADKSIRYGVDEVYGFTREFWDHEIMFETQPQIEAEKAGVA